MKKSTQIKLDKKLLDTYFKDTFDPVLHAPYAVGDVLTRCATCGAVIRVELLNGSACPANIKHTFVPAVVITREEAHLKLKHRIKRTNPTEKPAPPPRQRPLTPREMTRQMRRVMAIVYILAMLASVYGICNFRDNHMEHLVPAFAQGRLFSAAEDLIKRSGENRNHYDWIGQCFEWYWESTRFKLIEGWKVVMYQPLADSVRFGR